MCIIEYLSQKYKVSNHYPIRMAEYYDEDYPDPATLELRLVASSPVEKIKPELKVYRKGCSEQSIQFSTPDQVASSLHELFSGETMIIFIIHGFLNNIKTQWMHTMKEAILWQKEKEKEQVIVVLVGWGNGAGIGTFYYQAAANTEAVGKWLGEVSSRLMGLIRPRAGHKPRIWGVGHSLGAHVLGIAGRNSSKSFDRITGLDPAGPLFEKVHQDKRLHKEDATMVDVIHTDGYSKQRVYIGVNHYGTLIPLGTIDFYPNYGYQQPGASKTIAGSHSRVVDLFTWSVSNPKKFITNKVLDEAPGFGKPVEETHTVPYNAQMGYFANKRAKSGLFYLETKGQVPWQV